MGTIESFPKICKVMKSSDSIECNEFDIYESFLDDLLTNGQAEFNQYFKEALSDDVKREQMNEEEIARRVKSEVEEFKKLYRIDVEQKFEQKITSQLDALKKAHANEIEQLQKSHMKAIEKNTIEKNTYLVEQQKEAQNEINRQKTLYENQIIEWQRKCDELRAILNANQNLARVQQTEMESAEQNGPGQIDDLKKKYTTEIEQWKQSYARLKGNYANLSQKYNDDILRQNQAILNEQIASKDSTSAYRSQLNQWVNQYNDLKTQYNDLQLKLQEECLARKREMDMKEDLQRQLQTNKDELKSVSERRNEIIVNMQRERNDYLIKWKSTTDAYNQLKSQSDSMKYEYEKRITQMITQTRQQVTMQLSNQNMLVNQVNTSISTPSPSVTPQPPPESTSTPTPTNQPGVNNRERRCMHCNSRSRMFTTITYCSLKCKQSFL